MWKCFESSRTCWWHPQGSWIPCLTCTGWQTPMSQCRSRYSPRHTQSAKWQKWTEIRDSYAPRTSLRSGISLWLPCSEAWTPHYPALEPQPSASAWQRALRPWTLTSPSWRLLFINLPSKCIIGEKLPLYSEKAPFQLFLFSPFMQYGTTVPL